MELFFLRYQPFGARIHVLGTLSRAGLSLCPHVMTVVTLCCGANDSLRRSGTVTMSSTHRCGKNNQFSVPTFWRTKIPS